MFTRALLYMVALVFVSTGASAVRFNDKSNGVRENIPLECGPIEKYIFLVQNLVYPERQPKNYYGCVSQRVQYTINTAHVMRYMEQSETGYKKLHLKKYSGGCPHPGESSKGFCTDSIYGTNSNYHWLLEDKNSTYVGIYTGDPKGGTVFGYVTGDARNRYYDAVNKWRNLYEVLSNKLSSDVEKDVYSLFKRALTDGDNGAWTPPPTDPTTPTDPNPTDPTTPTTPTNPTDNTTNCGIIDIPCNFLKLFVPRREFFFTELPKKLSVNYALPIEVRDSISVPISYMGIGSLSIDFSAFTGNALFNSMLRLIALFNAIDLLFRIFGIPNPFRRAPHADVAGSMIREVTK